MKLYVSKGAKVSVAPFAGAWIEIVLENEKFSTESVAPFAGAWIEMPPCQAILRLDASLPSRERGLK